MTGAIDSRAYRDAVGRYASGVVVIGATAADGQRLGFTCQSFHSVSLDPPLISISVAQTSTTYPMIRETGRFAVSVLGDNHHKVASAFARKGIDRWGGVAHTGTGTGNPVLTESLMWLDCEIDAEHEAGDHHIVVGRVLEMSQSEAHRGEPLLFYRGGFHGIASLPATG
ncbi:flavin reductase family protein [Streptomyces europaeiscabiei]|uniref:flavin reductase family protein n=1 Tax=Streptomyces europaeiscabiei TaxID=146819 RepID=UPI0029B5DF43|nr:flavin reductase family protein [Streptomyces europaeiscabiei]MDX3696551.1 flavin reductase family protein [Streptomyces europaeiscabiei]